MVKIGETIGRRIEDTHVDLSMNRYIAEIRIIQKVKDCWKRGGAAPK
jgi:hypothetical protein